MSVQPIDFSWINTTDETKNNLERLSTPLKKNEHFEVDRTNNTIKIVKSEWFAKVVYYFQEKRINREVKELVKANIIEMANALPENLSDEQQHDVQVFFLERLAPLSQKIFDRKVFGEVEKVDEDGEVVVDGIKNKNLLPQILNPQLADTVKTDDNALDTQRKLQRRIEKTRLAINLGIELKPISQGASGSYFARDHKMKIIGVFKPGIEESSSTGTPKLSHRIKNCVQACFGINTAASFWPASGYVSEKLTTVLADHLDIDVVPRAEVTRLTSEKFVRAQRANAATEEEGSYQIFSPGTKSADEILKLNSMGPVFGNLRMRFNTWRYKDQISGKVSQPDFEKLAVTDGLILNKDRHFENWLIKKEPREDGTHEIVLIDNQLTFPKVNPAIDNRFYRRQQNKWGSLPHAEKPFSKEIKQDTTIALRGANLQALLDGLQAASTTDLDAEIKAFNEVDPGSGSSQELAFKQRVVVLLYAFEKDIPIREYAGIKSIQEMQDFTRSINPDLDFDLNDENALNAYLELPEAI